MAEEKVRLNEIVEFINGDRGKNYPSQADFLDHGIPFIGMQHLSDGRIDHDSLRYISQSKFDQLGGGKIERFDLLYCLRGNSVGSVGFVPDLDLGAIASSLVILRCEEPEDARFLYYVLSSQFGKELAASLDNGSAQPNISATTLGQQKVPFPSPDKRNAIASILGALDDKIELNRRMNATLESLARAIFKSWFVDFDPVHVNAGLALTGQMPASSAIPTTHDPKVLELFPSTFQDSELGPIPEGWCVGRLDELLVLQRGFDLPKKKRVEGEYPVYAAGGNHGSHNEFKVTGPGVVTGRSGVLGNVYYVHEDHWPLNTTLWVKEFKASRPIHAYHYLQGVGLKGFNAGSAVPTLNRNHVHGLPSIIPPAAVVESFEDYVQLLFNQHKQNACESDSISNFRDALLPQLLSGELPVPEALTHAEEALI